MNICKVLVKTLKVLTLSTSGLMAMIAAFQAVDPGSNPGWCTISYHGDEIDKSHD